MLGKMEVRTPPGSRPRDGRHCDLCGCSQPAVRCDKCGCQIFCLSCDDMYHRHPKRRFHLRKAVDPTPHVSQARPVLPVKVAHLNTINPGDPSKMPLPPPRKKKSLFGSFRRPSPSADNSPPLPKKEYSWTDRLGSIKKFMSNRPLPPLPAADDHDGEIQPTTNGQTTPPRGDLSFIHKRNEERPPQLPVRSPRPQDFPGFNQERDSRSQNTSNHMSGQIRNGSIEPNANHMNQNQDFSGDENQWNNRMPIQNGPQAFGTMSRQNNRGFIPPGGPGFPGGMHQSSSATDLHSMHNAEAMHGSGPVPPHYPHYPMNPHMPPHYPYPMYPQYPNYPQFFGNSFANLSNPPTTDGDVSDSESSTRHSSKKYPFRKRAKRSQSVLMDRMAYPGQFYPFGAYPGYGPWGAPMPMDAPPSPASSIRSLNRAGRPRRRKKTTSEDDDEEFSVSSSPLSRPKSSSSERLPKETPKAPLATQTTSSDDESEYEGDRRRNKVNTIRRPSEPTRTSSSPTVNRKRPPKLKKKSSSKQSDSEPQEEGRVVPDIQSERRASKESNPEQPAEEPASTSSGATSSAWECKHCTFLNPITNKICIVCCKTTSPRTETPVTASSRPSSAAESARKQSVGSEKSCSSPEKAHRNDEENSKKDKQDMAILNSALDEAEKEISRGLEELMKLKDDMHNTISNEKHATTSTETQAAENTKPVYKSSGKMRRSILDKLNINKPPTSKPSASTSTEVQTEQNNRTTDKFIEARRYSNSSTTSETYNSPLAQSPKLGDGFNKQKRDSSCQTQQDNLAEYLERKRAAEEAFLGRPINNFGFGYPDRMDMITSPVPSMYDRFIDRGFGMMQRSHSRASLFAGRINDLGPTDYGGPAFGYGAPPVYRSMSRGSLTGDYPDSRMSEFQNLRRPDYYLSMEELVERRRQEDIKAQGLELVRMIREAEQQGFTADDIQVALTHCGKQSPMEWLQNNWRNMVDSVITLSTNYGNDKKENDIGLLSENEARDALRLHKGNIWAAVTECVEGRQRKYLELSARGKFMRPDIIDALTASDGDVEMAYANLSKNSGKPFLMRIWGAGEGAQNQDGAQPMPEDLKNDRHMYHKDDIANCDELSDDLWSEDGAEVNWEEDEDDFEEERGDMEDLQTCREDLYSGSHEMRTPESDRSDYCDAFALEDKNMSPSSDDIFFVIPDAKPEKKKGFLSKLAALRKDSKEQIEPMSNAGKEDLAPVKISESKSDTVSQNSNSSGEQGKGNGTLSAIKSTFTAIKETVTGVAKSDKKAPCSQPERRTIIVTGQLDYEPLTVTSKENVTLTSVNLFKDDNILNQKKEIGLKENNVENKDKTNNENTTTTEEGKFSSKSQVVEDSKILPNYNVLENSPKQSDFKSKKTQSLAERLKFAKQSYPSKSEEKQTDDVIKNISNLSPALIIDRSPSTQEMTLKHIENKREDISISNQFIVDAGSTKEKKGDKRKEASFSLNFGESENLNNQKSTNKVSKNESHDFTSLDTISSSSSLQKGPELAIENTSQTSVEMPWPKDQEIRDILPENKENQRETLLQNKREEQYHEKSGANKNVENVSRKDTALKQKKSTQNSPNAMEEKNKSNANIASNSKFSGDLKSDAIPKGETAVEDTSISFEMNSSNILSDDGSERHIISESQNEQQYTDLKLKAMEKDKSKISTKTSNSSSHGSIFTVESPKVNNFSEETKSEIAHHYTDISNKSNDSKNASICSEISNQILVSKSDLSSSIDKLSTPPESTPNASSVSKDKATLELQESKQDNSGKFSTIPESKVASSSATTKDGNLESKDEPPSSSHENIPTLQKMVAETENIIGLNDLKNKSPVESALVNLYTDKNFSGKAGVTKDNISSQTENKQINYVDEKDINDHITSTDTLEAAELSSNQLQSTSENSQESTEKEDVKLQFDLDDNETEVLKSESPLSIDTINVEQSNSVPNVEGIVVESSIVADKPSDTSQKSETEQHSEQVKGEDSKFIQNLEPIPEQPEVINSTCETPEKSTTLITEKQTNDSSLNLKSGDTKFEKIKSSKTGKIKKSLKEKDLQKKNATMSEKSLIASSINASTSTNGKENKISDSPNLISLESETLSLASTSNTSNSNIEKKSGFSEDSDVVTLETQLPKDINRKSESLAPLDNEKTNESNLNPTYLGSSSVTSVENATMRTNQSETLISSEKLQTSSDFLETKSPSNVLPSSIQHSDTTNEPETAVASENIVSENSSDLKSSEMLHSSITSENELSDLSSHEAASDLPSDTIVTDSSLKSNNTELISIKHIDENKPSIINTTETSTSINAPENNLKVNDNTDISSSSVVPESVTDRKILETRETTVSAASSTAPENSVQHSKIQSTVTEIPSTHKEEITTASGQQSLQTISEKQTENDESTSQTVDSDDADDTQYSDDSRPSSVTPPSPVDALRNRFETLSGGSPRAPHRPQSPFRRMSFNSRKQVIALERIRDTAIDKPWFHQKSTEPAKVVIPKRTIKQQLEMERRVRKMVSDRKVRTYRKAEIVIQLMDMNFDEEEAILAADECSTLERAISYLQQECLLCAGHFPVSQIVSMTHCQHRACRECIRAYFTVQIRDRTILDLLCPFCNEPDIGDEDIAQDYFNHLDIMLKKLVDFEIHELFQRKLRDRVLMKDPNFRWCSQCSSGFIAMPNLKRLVCPDCNAVTCASCRRLWGREHQGITCEEFAALKDASDPETQAAGLAKMLTEDGISCPSCHFRYALAKGGCMHFRCLQCQHDFCSGCSRPFKMGQKCGVSEFCAKLGLHAHHPRNCLFYLRDKEPEDLQKLLDMNGIKYDKEPTDNMEQKNTCQVMEQKETTDGMIDDFCGKEVQEGYAGLCRVHYVEYLGQLVNKYKVDPIQIFDVDDLELVLRRASIRLPSKKYREADEKHKERLINLIQEELPLDKTEDGS